MKMILPTRQEMDLLVRLADSDHPLADELIEDKIRHWHTLTDEKRHQNYCPDERCCPRPDAPTQINHFNALEIDLEDINEYTYVVLKTEGYTPWAIIAYSFDWDFDAAEIKNGDNEKDFIAIPLEYYRQCQHKINMDIDSCPDKRWFKYEDVVLSLDAIPDYDVVEYYLNNKRMFLDNLTALETLI